MSDVHYGFVRASGDVPNLQELLAAGTNGLLFNPEDAGWEAGYQKALAAGMKAGLWIPAGKDAGDPTEYARKLAALSARYNPSVIVPDLEFAQKGPKGSAGWNWSDQMMAAFRQYAPNQAAAVTVMPNQGDQFNYGAFTSRGAPVWAQAYGATLDQQFDPAQVYQNLLNAGVPANMAQVVLAATQNPGSYQGDYSRYTVDDLLGKPIPKYTGGTRATGVQRPIPLPGSAGSPFFGARNGEAVTHTMRGDMLPDPRRQTYARPTASPRAIQYIQSQMAKLKKLGYTPEKLGIQGMDIRDQWRNMSSILGARQAAASGNAANYHQVPNLDSRVQEAVARQLLLRNTRGGR